MRARDETKNPLEDEKKSREEWPALTRGESNKIREAREKGWKGKTVAGRWAKTENRDGVMVTTKRGGCRLEPAEAFLGCFEAEDDMPTDLVLGTMSEEEKDGYEMVSGVVDTGAEEHAIPLKMLDWLPIRESELSRQGRYFRGADNSRIPAKGKRTFVAVTADGLKKRLACEVCPVRRLLLSGTKMARAGHRVVCEDKVGYIQNIKTGRKTYLRRDRNVWVLDMWIKKPEGFPRLGK